MSLSIGQISYVLLTRAPLTSGASPIGPFDLHVLGTPPAFTLSQDQTLQKNGYYPKIVFDLLSEVKTLTKSLLVLEKLIYYISLKE